MIKFRCVMINNERDLAASPGKIVDLFCLQTQMNTRCSTPYSQTCHPSLGQKSKPRFTHNSSFLGKTKP